MSNYFLYAIIPMILSLWAQYKVKGTYSKYSQIRTKTGITGAEAARKMLDAYGLSDVSIERVSGTLTDHYDPSKRVLRLSEGVYSSNSIAAVGVACHEAGHAYQHADEYKWLSLRTNIVPLVNFGSMLGPILFMVGLVFSGLLGQFGQTIAYAGLLIFGITAVFAVITLPVEFDASNRSKAWIANTGLLYPDEQEGVAAVLQAASLTYVAAAIQAITTVLYYASFLNRSNRRR
ncbi:MAG: zinc metallopeptidase [Flexilinea sp.]